MPDAATINEQLDIIADAAGLDREHARRSAIFRTIDYWLWGLRHGFTEDPLRCRRLVTALLQRPALHSHGGSRVAMMDRYLIHQAARPQGNPHRTPGAQGYTATTIDQIAGRAAVSKPTVFAVAGSKQAILKQLRDIALAGDEPVPVAQRSWYREALAEPDLRRALRLYARNVTAIHGRSADVHEVLRAAATSDKDLYKLWRAGEDERCGGAAIVVDALLQKCRLKAG